MGEEPADRELEAEAAPPEDGAVPSPSGAEPALADGRDERGARVPLRRLRKEIARRRELEQELELYRSGGSPPPQPDDGWVEPPQQREVPPEWDPPGAPSGYQEPFPQPQQPYPPQPVGDFVSRDELDDLLRGAVQYGTEAARLSFKYNGDQELVQRLLDIARENPDVTSDDAAYEILVQRGEIVRPPDAPEVSDLDRPVAPLPYQEPVRGGLGRDQAELERDPRHQAAKREAELLRQARSEVASGAPRRGGAGQQLIRERLFKNG